MKKLITEAHAEENVLDILKKLDYDVIYGDREEYLPKGSKALRQDYKDVILVDRLKDALVKINPSLSQESIEQVIKKVLRNNHPVSPSLRSFIKRLSGWLCPEEAPATTATTSPTRTTTPISTQANNTNLFITILLEFEFCYRHTPTCAEKTKEC